QLHRKGPGACYAYALQWIRDRAFLAKSVPPRSAAEKDREINELKHYQNLKGSDDNYLSTHRLKRIDSFEVSDQNPHPDTLGACLGYIQQQPALYFLALSSATTDAAHAVACDTLSAGVFAFYDPNFGEAVFRDFEAMSLFCQWVILFEYTDMA